MFKFDTVIMRLPVLVMVRFSESCCADCKANCAFLYIAVGVHQMYIQLPNGVILYSADEQ